MSISLKLGVEITVDETAALQNSVATAGVAGDANDNDISVGSINGSTDGDLPDAFEARLYALFGNTTVPDTQFKVALSGYAGSGNGDDLVTITNSYTDLAFTDAAGLPLDGDWSGLYTTDGTQIFLYTDTDNNVVLGRKGTAAGDPNAEDDTANPSGQIVFAGYLEQTATGAKVWMVQFAPIYNTVSTDPDDPVDLSGHLWVGMTQQVGFDFTGVPSGQNLFLMFADTSRHVGIVVTGRAPADQSEGAAVNTGDTVNTSKGGGATTIGTNNQMIDPLSDPTAGPGEGMVFSFVTDPVDGLTVPNLTHGEAVLESNIDFGGLFETSGAVFVFAQMQPPKGASVKLTAYEADFEEKSAYVNGLLDDGTVGIDRVKVYATSDTNAAPLLDVAIGDTGVVVGTAFAEAGMTVTFGTDGTVVVSGVRSKNALEYHTVSDHNRVLIENAGSTDASNNSAFDIGGFFLPNDVVTPLQVGAAVNFEDDAPKFVGAATATVDEDGLTGQSVGIAGGPGDVTLSGNESVATGIALSTMFSAGTDGLQSFSFDDTFLSGIKAFDTAATPAEVTLRSKGDLVSYDVVNTTLWGFVDGAGGTAGQYDAGTDRDVFKLVLTNATTTGDLAFTLLDQLDHPDTVGGDDTENELVLQLGSVLKITDGDGDSLAGTADSLKVTVDDDTPVFTSISNIVGFNTGAPLTGVYDAKLGADEPGNDAGNGVVLLSVAATTSGARANLSSPAPTVTRISETDTSVTYDFGFTYYTSSVGSTTAAAAGTVTFDKINGTYVVDLAGPINGSTVFSTSGGASLNYDTMGNNSPEITVKAYASDFFGVLSGQAASPPSDHSDLTTDDADYSFAPGDTFKSTTTSYVNVSTDTVGVDSDTIQNGELLNYDFYTQNPVSGATSPPQQSGASVNPSTPKAYVDAVDVTLNQVNLGHEDVAILLKLYNPTPPAGDPTETTKLLLANSISDYVAVPGSTNVVVHVDASDYPAGYRISGIQVLTSTEDITGTGYKLSDGSPMTLGSIGNDLADTSDSDVMKIIKIEVSVNRPADADLTFTGKLVDADGDTTPASPFSFSVHLEGDTTALVGGAGSDYLNGTSADETLTGGAGADFMAGGGGADQFVFAPGDSNADPLAYDTITDFASGADQIVTSKAAGDAQIATGSTDFAGFVANANTYLAGAGAHSIYVEYDAAGSGNAWVVIDEDDSNGLNAGDSIIVLTGINLNTEIAAADFV